MGLDLAEALADYCQRHGYKTFKLFVRLSKEKVNPARWDETFVEKAITGYDPESIKRVWVCGPPVMCELFDRILSQMRKFAINTGSKKYIEPHRLEIL